ncbi:MAG TPA: methylated-DNA--[protein]-cysteine S-methyltransferase [Thermodesulfobacteriota bacterium]|nr:methylated-DNA--[protein]-cysteine S-methyltransferase [Thermodesulfobacteriota bacterium]
MENIIYYSSFDSPFLGKVFVASTERGICMVDFLKGEKAFLDELRESFPGKIVRDDRKNRNVLDQLKKYLKGELRRFDCKLDFRGTPFQKKVWSALKKIPYGRTRSYGEIARDIGHPKAFRAVGNANGRNYIPLIVPCHRVIENSGGLGGFGHGLKVKKQLLDLEKANRY